MILDRYGKALDLQYGKVDTDMRPSSKNNEIMLSAGGAEYFQKLETLKSSLFAFSQRTGKNRKTMPNPIGLQSKIRQQPEMGKDYPGARSLLAYRAIAWSSSVVQSIISFRRGQITKKDLILVPKIKEPSFRVSILEYSVNDILELPSLEYEEKYTLVKLLLKIDPLNESQRKNKNIFQYEENLSSTEINLLKWLDKKHWDFYTKRREDTRNILTFLHNPDPFFSEESSWRALLSGIIEDNLILDRGAAIKIRNDRGQLVAIVGVDGYTIRPFIDPDGYLTHYTQVIDNEMVRDNIDKKDVILMRTNVTNDIYMYGYGVPPLETLYTVVISDLFIDKGNADYYRKGGSVPEILITVEPPGKTEDGTYVALDKQQLDAIQRQLQAVLMGDFTQVPVVSGGKFSVIDLKGKRRDMQFRELAEYLTRKICAVFQVSPQDVGILSEASRANAEIQSSLTKSKGLETLAFLVSEAFTKNVVDEFREDKDLKLWFEEDDMEKERDWWNIQQGKLGNGFRTINEIRAEKGLNPVPWGDTPLQGLKNWSPLEQAEAQQQQQAGPPGAPPGMGPPPGMGGPPGMDAVAMAGGGPSPMDLQGQMPGMAPSLGQAPMMKSVLTELYQAAYSEEYEKLDVNPLVKSFFNVKPDLDTAILKDELKINNSDKNIIQLTDVADFVLENNIKDIGIRFLPPQSFSNGEYELTLQLADNFFEPKNLIKLIYNLYSVSGDPFLKHTEDFAEVSLYDAIPLGPTGDKAVRKLTQFLYGTSCKNVTVKFTKKPLDENFYYKISENTTIKQLINKVKSQEDFIVLCGIVKPGQLVLDEDSGKELNMSEMLLDKAQKMFAPGFSDSIYPSIYNLFNLANSEKDLNFILKLLKNSEVYDSFYENYYDYVDTRSPRAAFEKGLNLDFRTHKTLNDAYVLFEDKTDYFVRAFTYISQKQFGTGTTSFDTEDLVGLVFAYVPDLRMPKNQAQEVVRAYELSLMSTLNLVKDKFDNPHESMSSLFSPIDTSMYAPEINFVSKFTSDLRSHTPSFDPEEKTEDLKKAKEEVHEAYELLSNLIDIVFNDTFINPQKSFISIVEKGIEQAFAKISRAVHNYKGLKEAAIEIIHAELPSIEITFIEDIEIDDEDTLIKIISDKVVDETEDEDLPELPTQEVEIVIKSILYGEEYNLTDEQLALLSYLKKRK